MELKPAQACGSFYDELGVAADASVDDIRAAYRRQARQRHPDVAGAADSGGAMRKLNEAWAVLGDPERRRQYDLTLAGPAPPSPAAATPSVNAAPAQTPRRPPFLRPSVLILLVLAGIFVVTAYAGAPPGNNGTPTPAAPTPSTLPGSASVHPVGQCLAASGAAGDIAIVACSNPHFGQILAEAATPGQCPTGTVARPWALRPTVLCTVEAAPAR